MTLLKLAIVSLREAAQTVEVAKQLVGAIDEMDDHEQATSER
jgi:hypothetical protein